MDKNSLTFANPIKLAHLLWRELLKKEDWVVDATCGNGKDTLYISTLLGKEGGLIAMDIQPEAIEKTKNLLLDKPEDGPTISYFLGSHANPPDWALDRPLGLVVYNLGYLPGGNKELITQKDSTLTSLKKFLSCLRVGGAVSIVCYPGHQGGKEEQEAVYAFARGLSRNEWDVSEHRWEQREKAPSLLFIQKKF